MINIVKNTLTETQLQYLQKLGLSNHAIKLYELMLNKGRLTAQAAAAHSNRFASAHYRLFYELERQGLVRRRGGRPLMFEAMPLPTGLQAAFVTKQAELKKLLATIPNETQAKPTSELELIVGRQALYDRYIELAAQAKHEIQVYAIGIAYSAQLLKTQKAAIQRHVSVKQVIQQLKAENYHIALKWQRIGAHVRLAPSERGFHFLLIDRKIVLITFSDPSDTENRLSILTDNPTAVQLFASNFQALWHDATPLEL